jgi:hypothetical protein
VPLRAIAPRAPAVLVRSPVPALFTSRREVVFPETRLPVGFSETHRLKGTKSGPGFVIPPGPIGLVTLFLYSI